MVDEELKDAPKRFGCIPYSAYRWMVCFSVMIGLIPMAGTMTSFGTIKEAITKPQNCSEIKTESSRASQLSDPEQNITPDGNSTLNCTDWTDSAYVGYEGLDESPMVVSFVGSLVFGFTVGSSVVTSPIVAKIGYRWSGIAGVLLGITVSLITSRLANFYVWFLTYSFLFGVANNLVYNTGMQMCNAFFPVEYNTAATVIGSFGISLGTVVMNKVSIWATDNFGWRNRFIVCAIMQAAFSLPAVIMWGQPYEAKKEEKENKDEKGKEENEETELITGNGENKKEETEKFNLFTDISFWCWLWGTTFWSLDFVIPLDFAVGFMTQDGNMSRDMAGNVMAALGFAELASRIVCALTGEQKYISKPTLYILTSIVGALSCFLPIIAKGQMGDDEDAVMSAGIMFVYAIVVGFCAGVLNCLIMACTVDIFGQSRTVEVWNYVSIMLGVGFVGGPPIGAWFTSSVVPSLVYVFYLAIVFFALCAIVMLPIPIIARRKAALNNSTGAAGDDNRADTTIMT